MKKKRFYIPAIILLLIVGAWSVFGGGNGVPDFETATVENANITRIISETGTIAAAEEVDLAFTTSGRITSILVKEGQEVRAGDPLVRLDATQALAALRAAEARALSASGATSQSISQQDQLVDNAYKSLMTTDLQAYFAGSSPVDTTSWSYEQPEITGTYSCKETGKYTITLYPSNAVSGYSFRVSGLEANGTGAVSTSQPQPIGSCGLFIQFPEDFVRGGDVAWEIPIPNTRSATYTTRLGAYEAAKEARKLASVDEQNAPIYAAEVEQARAALADLTLTAPFSGIITSLSATLGQIASPGTPVLSLISAGSFEVTINIPEDDISDINPGDIAEITFDAIENVTLQGEVAYVAPAANTESGFAAFEVIVQLDDDNPQIRSGLTADVDIYADSREEVLAVPVRAVIEEDGTRYVRIMEGEASYYRVPVSVGLRGEGMYEITGGLSGGERIITFANTAALDTLTDLGVRAEENQI